MIFYNIKFMNISYIIFMNSVNISNLILKKLALYSLSRIKLTENANELGK